MIARCASRLVLACLAALVAACSTVTTLSEKTQIELQWRDPKFTAPPMALAQPPPLTPVRSHGSHALADTKTAKSATSQPGRSRRVMLARLTDSDAGPVSERAARRRRTLGPQRRQVEDRTRGIARSGQPSVRGVLGVAHHRAAVVDDHPQDLVDVLGAEEDHPVRREVLGQKRGAVHDADGHMVKLCEGTSATKTATDCTASGTGATTLALVWNALDHLVTATRTGSGAIAESYVYDDSGRRISKTSGGTTTSYLYDGDAIHAEWAGSINGMPQAAYVHGAGIDEPLFPARPQGRCRFPLTDISNRTR